jgi:hypothetical protein
MGEIELEGKEAAAPLYAVEPTETTRRRLPERQQTL